MKSKPNDERRKALPQSNDLEDAAEVWKSGEVAPFADNPAPLQTGPLGRVADVEDIGSRSPSVYGTEIQAEMVGTYTKHPARGRRKTSRS